jgi:hypothetical protein
LMMMTWSGWAVGIEIASDDILCKEHMRYTVFTMEI